MHLTWLLCVSLVVFCSHPTMGQYDSGMVDGRSVIVQLFEWPFKDIKEECKNVLGPQRFGGVLVSPIAENAIIKHQVDGKIVRPWWEKYQPVSWKIITQSGNEQEFAEMVKECNANGVRVYVDVVINHAVNYQAGDAQGAVTGVGGSTANLKTKTYPGLDLVSTHFHPSCTMDFTNKTSVRICELFGLQDIDQTQTVVQDKIVAFLNRLIDLGVAGFRIDAAKHIWPLDLKQIFRKLKDVSFNGGKSFIRPYFMLEVIDNESTTNPDEQYQEDYSDVGSEYDFSYMRKVIKVFTKGSLAFSNIYKYVKTPLYESKTVQVFGTSPDFQRDQFKNLDTEYTDTDQLQQEMINAFILTFPRGVPNIFSGYKYKTKDDGPPADQSGAVISPSNCADGWTCEHRFKPVQWVTKFFANVLQDAPLNDWWSEWNGGAIQAAFTRGKKGFAVFNADSKELQHTFKIPLPAGVYCDLATGFYCRHHKMCMGTTGSLKRKIEVKEDGSVSVYLPGIPRSSNENKVTNEPPYLVISTESMYPPEEGPSDKSKLIGWVIVGGVAVILIAGVALWAYKKYR